MTQRCPHCRHPISFSVTVSVTDLSDVCEERNEKIIEIKKKFPKMTVRAIAEAIGCSYATVSRVLREAAE